MRAVRFIAKQEPQIFCFRKIVLFVANCHNKKMRPWYDDHTLWCEDTGTKIRRCEHHQCRAEGSYRAPFSPQQTDKFRWFCLEHVRDYNSRWDFAKGLGPDEIEQLIRFDTSWQRETRPMGNWRTKENLLRAKAARFAGGHAQSAHTAAPEPKLAPKIMAALAILDFDDMPPQADLQARYYALVKKHHPDANGGSKESEERFKRINQAYAALKEFLR